MAFVIVHNVIRDTINAKLDSAIAEHPDAEKYRQELYDWLLWYYDSTGSIPDFTLEKNPTPQAE